MTQNLSELQEGKNKPTVLDGDFNTQLSITDRTSRKKITEQHKT